MLFLVTGLGSEMVTIKLDRTREKSWFIEKATAVRPLSPYCDLNLFLTSEFLVKYQIIFVILEGKLFN